MTKCAKLLFTELLVLLSVGALQGVAAQDATRRFTVADDVAVTQLHLTDSSQPYDYATANFSPDNKYFVVLADRGRLDLNKMESFIRVYRTDDAVDSLRHPEEALDLAPFWNVSLATFKYGPIISDVRWLPDSSGLAFLGKTASGNDQLFLADIAGKTLQSLTPEEEHVTGFDVRSKQRFVYALLSPSIQQNAANDSRAVLIPGTGRNLYDLLFPGEDRHNLVLHDLSELWAVIDGKRFHVADEASKRSLPIHTEGQNALALSPDGRYVVTALTVSDVPTLWEALFHPPSSSYPYRIRAGPQNPDALSGFRHVSEFVLVDLRSSGTKRMTHAPIGFAAGWSPRAHADWSADGQSVVLSNTFLAPPKRGLSPQANKPCVVVADILTESLVCLDASRQDTLSDSEKGSERLLGARFVHGSKDTVMVTYSRHTAMPQLAIFVRQSDGSWRADKAPAELAWADPGIDISVREGIAEPPVLVARDKTTSAQRTIWNPNRQLKDIKLGEASVFKWKDKTGRDWVGGLYKPPDYVPGMRYPLVIQSHAFTEHNFLPSGSYPTAFAAQELAAVGLMVLQVESCPLRSTSEEGACQVAGYEAAVDQLTIDGLVDPDRLGIVGFSRGCYYVVETLTTSALQFKAVLLADGITYGYGQYIDDLDLDDNLVARSADVLMGAAPFGAGLGQWIARSPLFRMTKVNAPVEVLARAGGSILGVWEPYAVLRYLHKPVDLVIINSEEHVFTNPANRMISQGNTVDWFRFWLQDFEDADPLKRDQYERWETLRANSNAGAHSSSTRADVHSE